MSRRVIVLRHGRTAWNAERRFQGQTDPPLDEVGRAQAVTVAGLLATLRPAVIITSDLARAAQTAVPLGQLAGVGVHSDVRLRERSLGHWEGLTREEVQERYPAEFEDWLAGRDVRGRGGETREDVAKRALAAFTELPDVAVAVLVTHSATAMALCSSLIGADLQRAALGSLANCHWSELQADDEVAGSELRWRLRAHNVGAPGPVIPVSVASDVLAADGEDAPDARA